jgi:hypothetical protein
VQLQLLGMRGEISQVVLEGDVGVEVRQHLAVEDAEPVLTCPLGLVEGDVGIPEKGLGGVTGPIANAIPMLVLTTS